MIGRLAMTLIGAALAAAAASAAVAEPLPRVVMETPEGRIVVEVEVVRAPKTAANFLRHVDEGLYKGARFYRVVRKDNDPRPELPMRIIQGGISPNASPLPPVAHETTQATGLKHVDGAISVARLAPGTAGSEFFIVIGSAPGLDFGPGRNADGQGYAVFGRVVEGMDVVRRINSGSAGGGDSYTTGQVLTAPVPITSVKRAGN
jgi:peptidyl-prolyl cis-trans isomerase A (cyclophilin A)